MGQTGPDAAQKIELTKRYLELAEVNKMMRSMMTSVVSAMPIKDMPPQVAKAVRESVMESTDAIFPKMTERMVGIYADAFTLEELEGIVAFYDSPVGRAVTTKTPLLIESSAKAINAEFAPILQRDMVNRMCVKLHCSPQQKAEALKGAGL